MNIFLKKDYMQYTGSFKERGARYTLVMMSDEEKRRGVISASAGNHALGLAYHGQQLGTISRVNYLSLMLHPLKIILIYLITFHRHSRDCSDARDSPHHEGGELQEDGCQGCYLRIKLRRSQEEGSSHCEQEEAFVC
jgi:hypothetical protein